MTDEAKINEAISRVDTGSWCEALEVQATNEESIFQFSFKESMSLRVAHKAHTVQGLGHLSRVDTFDAYGDGDAYTFVARFGSDFFEQLEGILISLPASGDEKARILYSQGDVTEINRANEVKAS